MTDLTKLTIPEQIILHRDIALDVVYLVPMADIAKKYDLTPAQLTKIREKPTFVEALVEAQREKEKRLVEAGIATHVDILEETRKSLDALVTIRDLHTPGVEVPDVPLDDIPRKKDHQLAASISQDLLSRGGLSQIRRESREVVIKIDSEAAALLTKVLGESETPVQTLQLSPVEVLDGRFDTKTKTYQLAKDPNTKPASEGKTDESTSQPGPE